MQSIRQESASVQDQETKMASSSMPEWFAQVEDFLKCISCRQTIIDPPVYRCRNEHLMCDSCNSQRRAADDRCLRCRDLINMRRSVLAENIIGRLPQNMCLFEGCEFARADNQAVVDHELSCFQRPILCYTCYESVPVAGMVSHLTTIHETRTWCLRMGQAFRWTRSRQAPNGTIRSDTLLVSIEPGGFPRYPFFSNVTVVEGRYLFWVTHAAPSSQPYDHSFTYTISVYTLSSKGGKSVTLAQHTGFCTSHDSHPTAMKNSMFCLVVPQEIIEKSLNSDGWYGLETTINDNKQLVNLN